MKLLAPNGKPSNLTPEQYKLVRTPEFKGWFGDWENSPKKASKVVDENGEPLVLNRGNLVIQEELGYTFNLGQNFLKKQSSNKFGFFFTNNIDIAKKYMLVDHFDEIRGGSITSVFMQSNKILDLLDFDLKIGQDDFIQGLIKKGINFNNGYNYLENKILDFNPDNYKYWGYNVFDYFDVFPELRNLFMENGFNSVIFYEMSRTYSKYKVYVAFESNQIKLADGTNTTFDGSNPDIRFSNGGELRPFTYDGSKFVVFSEYRNYTPYKIAVNDVNDADYITLWKTDINTGKDKKVGALKLNETDNLLKVSEIGIDRGSRGLGLGLEMYKVALKYSSDKIKGIASYLPDRSNRKQIPKIYKKLNSVVEGDWSYIYKKDNKYADELEINFTKQPIVKKITPYKNPDIYSNGGDVRPYEDGGVIIDDNIKVFGLNNYTKSKKSGKFYKLFAEKKLNDKEFELWWIYFTIKDGKKTLGFLRYRFENQEKDIYNEREISLSDLPKSLLDFYNKFELGGSNPDIRFNDGGELKFNEEAQQLIDIISMNPNLEQYQKYKLILKDKFGIDFDLIYKDQEYIENANLNDIKKQNDFLDFDNWLKYAKIISKKRGFIPMNLYDTPNNKYELTDEIWNETAKKLNFNVKKIPYIERGTGSGDIARAFGSTIYYTDQADIYYFLHELGHVYDFQNRLEGIIKNPAYSPTNYGTTHSGETFAENFAIYFINPIALKNWNEDVYNAIDLIINDKYKKEIYKILSKNHYSNGGGLDSFTHTIYFVTGETEAHTNEIYTGSDYDKALLEFNSADISDVSDYGGIILLSKITSTYKFIGDLEDGYYEISDFPIEDYYNDKDYYKLIEEGEIEGVDSRDIKPINEKSEELLSDISGYYKREYGNWKYNKIIVDNGKDEYDDDYKEYGCIQLRIADHSENVNNIDKFGSCDYYISVVIADKDKTSMKFLTSMYERRHNEVELKFDSSDTFESIVESINNEIENAKGYILDKKQMKKGGELKIKSIDNLYKDHHDVWAESEKIIKDVCKENCAKYSTKIYHLYELELKPHFEEEENDFFKKAINEENRKDIESLIIEHKKIAELCKKIKVHKKTSDIKRFCRIIINHIKKEEVIMNKITPDPYKAEEVKKSEYKYFLVIKNKKPIFKVKFSKHNKETEREMSNMLDKLHDANYILKMITEKEYDEFDYNSVNKEDVAEFTKNWSFYKDGGIIKNEQEEVYKKWKELVNMSPSELRSFLDSEEGKVAGLTKEEADDLGIDYGRESAKWILKMKAIPYKDWTPSMWRWAKKQISFISRMKGNKGKLYDENGKRTRKYLSLLVWGSNPLKK
jgi:hypothetical protein